MPIVIQGEAPGSGSLPAQWTVGAAGDLDIAPDADVTPLTLSFDATDDRSNAFVIKDTSGSGYQDDIMIMFDAFGNLRVFDSSGDSASLSAGTFRSFRAAGQSLLLSGAGASLQDINGNVILQWNVTDQGPNFQLAGSPGQSSSASVFYVQDQDGGNTLFAVGTEHVELRAARVVASNLPTSDPHAVGELWVDTTADNVVKQSAG